METAMTSSQLSGSEKYKILSHTGDTMTEQPVKDIIEHLGRHLPDIDQKDTVLLTGTGEKIPIQSDKFKEIHNIENPKKIAFVDGGEGVLEEAPNFLIMINRIYFSLFCGRERVKLKTRPRAEFFSIVSTSVTPGENPSITYSTILFPHTDADRQYQPEETDLTLTSNDTTALQGSRINSQSRSFAEWKLARHVVKKELDKGDIIVMDGSLQTGFKNEARYTEDFYHEATSKGVIVCGLSKTSRLVTEVGEPLFVKISEMGKDIKCRWYLDIAKKISRGEKGHVFAVKLHPGSRAVYRFEILQDQFEKMNDEEINDILASLAANSGDVAMPGYPYGLVDADRFAQVRNNELGMYRRDALSRIMHYKGGKNILKYINANKSHEHLNGVTS
ncbi:MAG: DNA double-strand break repair nuclease NurA [Nitrosopumilus sp. B06]|nr:MAG: DNA double-strand break repair nuclease NurA [Nitrosopumilus sp. B06]